MRQYIFSLTAATVCGAALAAASGCGDNLGGGGVAPSDAGLGRDSGGNGSGVDGAPVDGPSVDGPPVDGAPIDTGSVACAPVWQDFQSGTALDDQVWGMATDENNNLYVAGYEQGVNGVSSNNLDPSGDSQGVVMKIDPRGQVRWKTTLDTSDTDTVEDVAVEPGTGRIYAVGRTYGAFDGFVNGGQFDMFLAALDADGKTTTIFQTGDERPQHPARLNLGPNNVLAVAGYDDTYIPSNFVMSRDDGFIASFDRSAIPNGNFTTNFVQYVPLSPNILNRITGVAVERDGSGSMYVTSLITGGAQVGIYVKKLNSNGTTAWSHPISRFSVDAANAVALSPSGDLYVTGATFATLGATSFGQQDAYVLKMDKATGNVIWAAQAGGPDSDYPTALAFDDGGNIYIAGQTLGIVAPGNTNQGSIDAFAMKFDPSGTLVSTWQKGTADDEIVTSMAVDHCGNVFVGGHSKGAVVDSSKPTAGGYDMFILRAAL